jgi:hypothetical protein
METSNVTSLTYTLPATDQGLALTYSITSNGGTTASVSGNVLTYSSKGATGTYTIALSGGLASSIMAEAALASRVFNFNANETYGLYTFSSHTFTTAGLTGKFGPTLAQCKTAYSSASWAQNTSYFNVDSTYQGIQVWVVPKSGSYTITAAGAGNGVGYGSGVIISATFNLTMGATYRIIAGQRGGNTSSGCGGSFVASGTATATSTPVIIAGGAGGGTNAVTNATTNNNGVSAYSAGGTGGNGGDGGNGGSGPGNGGGGFYSYSGWSADGFRDGGVCRFGDGLGGFGGGGSVASGLCGGGGGYSGGGGGWPTSFGGSGGGGGSYSLNTMTPQGNNSGSGYVTITFVG